MFLKGFLVFRKRRLQVVGVVNILTKTIFPTNNESNAEKKRSGKCKKLSSRNIAST